MIREIYFRDSSDSRYDSSKLDEDSSKEILLNKIRMILYTNRGEILGAPELGLDLEDNLFDFNMPLDFISQKFYAQLAKYVPEVVDYRIDINYDVVSTVNSKIVNIYISINNVRELGISLG